MMFGTNGFTGMTGGVGWWALPMLAAMLAGLALVAFGGVWLYRQLSDRSAHRSAVANTASTGLTPHNSGCVSATPPVTSTTTSTNGA